MSSKWRFAGFAVALAAWLATQAPAPVYAHGFGDRYDLPVPLWLYITGAGAAVVLSFVVIGFVIGRSPGLHGYARLDLLRTRVGRVLFHPVAGFLLQLIGVLLFLLLIVAGLAGSREPTLNVTPVLVWVVFWVGIAFVSALLGNVWAVLNPWKTLFGWAEWLNARIRPDRDLSLNTPYPAGLGAWPAVGLFALFAWVEIVYPNASQPRNLAVLALLYTAITFAGMFVFDKHLWLRNGEVFSQVFGLFSRFAPTEVRVTDPEVCEACTNGCPEDSQGCVDCYECFEEAEPANRQINARPFAAGLLHVRENDLPRAALVVLVLATVTFDGFGETSAWADIVRGTDSAFSVFGGQALTVVSSLGLLVFAALFTAVYIGFSRLMAVISTERPGVGELARVFVWSLVPIALAYHLAHFFSFLLIQGQLIIPLASDPLGRGWDLFGSADYRIDIAIVNARLVWFVVVTAIVVGHIIAVYLAHVAAIRFFRTSKGARQSQYPMLLLMVGYTMLSLWILAQPITEARSGPAQAVGQLGVSAVTVQYSDGGFVPDTVEINQGEQVKFLNGSDGPFWPASNIHPTHRVYPGLDAKEPIGPGEAWVFNFDQIGVWRYHNHLSPAEGGTIVVRGEATAPRTVREAIDPAELQFKELEEVSAETAFDLFNDDAMLISYVREYGPASVVRALSEHGNQAGSNCHPRAHDLGRIAYQLFGAAAFSLSGHECQSGGYHGATEALFRERGTADLQTQIPLVCGTNLNRFFRHQCIHGVGHGIMAWTNYELLEALEICDGLSGGVDPQSCYSGAFMENVVGGLSGAMGHFTSYLSDDPHFPCNVLEDRHVAPCYFYQTSRMVHLFAGDFQQVAVACSQAPATAQRLCFQSMGRDVGGWSRKNPQQAIRLCAFVEDARYHVDCLEGAAQDSFWDVGAADDALTFCGLVAEGDEKRRCYATIVERAGHLYESPDGVRAFCEQLEDRYRTGCP